MVLAFTQESGLLIVLIILTGVLIVVNMMTYNDVQIINDFIRTKKIGN